MFTSHTRACWVQVERTAATLAASCLLLLSLGATASAASNSASQPTTRSQLHSALAGRSAASHALTSSSRRLKRCLRAHRRRPRRCAAARRAVRRAALRLKKARLLAAQIAGTTHQAAKQAPALAASGETLSWSQVSTVGSYVLARKAPGQSTQYSTVEGTTDKPPATPGATVGYTVRTNVKGSAWSNEVSIAYPTTTTSSTTSSTTTTTGGGSGAFEMGLVAGSALSYELPFIQKLGAHTARMEFSIATAASQLAPVIEQYASAGVRPLLLASFNGRLPSSGEARNLASWAAEFGPNGNFWKGKAFPAGTAVTDIEFGNETSYEYQFSDNSPAAYAERAQTYALRLKEAHEAIQAANPGVGVLGQADDGGNGPAWVENMFAAVPDLGQLVAGWTIHPYGPGWEADINRLISQTSAAGAPSTVPIDVTEWGLSSDNGRCLSDNYGFNKCMTYQEAAGTLQSNLEAMRARYPRLAAFYLYEARDEAATGTSTEREAYFGALQSDEAQKGAYTTTVQGLLSANP